MPGATIPSPSTQRLAGYLFDAADHPLTEEITGWLANAPRFRAFCEANRDKIRKKLRTAKDPEAGRDVRAELAVARVLLRDRKIEIAFEAYGSGNGGPDFTIVRGGERFNLEVTRVRGASGEAGFGGLTAKLQQLPPSAPNGVLLAVAGTDAAVHNVAEAVRALRTRADSRDDAFFTARGFAGARGFYDRFLRLGAVVVWAEAATGEARATAWTNPSARTPFPARGLRACVAALRDAPA